MGAGVGPDRGSTHGVVRVGCFIMTGTVLIRRAAIDTRSVGFINPGYASYDDYLLYLTIALDWRIAHENRLVMRYRRHPGNLTNVLYAENLARARANLLELFVERFPEARLRAGAEIRRTMALQLMAAAAHERSKSNLRAIRWSLAALRHEPRVAVRRRGRACVGEARQRETGVAETMRAVILAGGLGTRLRPYTTVLPKPLVPVGERPILEHILMRLHSSGVRTVDLCVGHLGELIQVYFSQTGSLPEDLDVRWHWESEPLGTAGALRLVPDLDGTFLVMNGDVLTNLDYAALIRFHEQAAPR